MLVDIAIRALSPAVNDPTTAVQSLDRIEALLRELAARTPGPSVVVDADGVPRARVPAPTWRAYVELGLMEIRRYGASSPQIVRRLHALYDHLGEVADESERGRIDLERRLLDEEVARAFPDPAEREIVDAARPARAWWSSLGRGRPRQQAVGPSLRPRGYQPADLAAMPGHQAISQVDPAGPGGEQPREPRRGRQRAQHGENGRGSRVARSVRVDHVHRAQALGRCQVGEEPGPGGGLDRRDGQLVMPVSP